LFIVINKLTVTTESRAAIARISAQETTPGQAASTLVLMSSITSKPLRELTFAAADFSPVKVEVSSNRTDASHPYKFVSRNKLITNIQKVKNAVNLICLLLLIRIK